MVNIGEMAEWSNAAVSKTVVRLPANRGFESPSLRKALQVSFPWITTERNKVMIPQKE